MNNNRTYYKRKEKGLCVMCGKVPPLKGKVRCAECTEKSKARQKEWGDKNKEKKNEYYRQDKEYFKRTHTCIKCRCRETYFGHIYCPDCLEKRQELRRNTYNLEKEKEMKQKRRERLLNAGLCVYCGKEPPIDGKLACEKCRTKQNKQVRKFRQKRKEANGYIPREEWADYGMCEICKAPIKQGYRVCEKHYQHLCKISPIESPARDKVRQDCKNRWWKNAERKAD